jgi:hypothetical protein
MSETNDNAPMGSDQEFEELLRQSYEAERIAAKKPVSAPLKGSSAGRIRKEDPGTLSIEPS